MALSLSRPSLPARHSFLIKVGLATALVALADRLFFGNVVGTTAGAFAAVWIACLAVARPALLRSPAARVALAGAALMALSLAEAPSILAVALLWAALVTAALMPRFVGFDDAWRWSARLLRHAVAAVAGLWRDARNWLRLHRKKSRPRLRLVPLLALPIIGSVAFLALFAHANPLIEASLRHVDFAYLLSALSVGRIVFWLAILTIVWATFRPGLAFRTRARLAGDHRPAAIPGVSVASVGLSLFAFNALFAVENALDIVFLWSGAPLPGSMTLAEYAHRGAYPLIGTALLAGLFVLVALRPRSETAASAALRWLVYVWIGQNILLVASSILRTIAYIDAFSMTRLRLAALIWMVLVAVGLALICWRIAGRKSGAWLINANAVVGLAVLAACSVADLGTIAATWNVRHNLEVTGEGSALDLCYLRELGVSALLPLIALEREALPEPLRGRAQGLRSALMHTLQQTQADWHGWSFHNARRLAAAAEALDAAPGLPRHAPDVDRCERPIPPAALTVWPSQWH